MRKIFLAILLCASTAAAGPRDGPDVTLRKRMEAELRGNQAKVDFYFSDMHNQFTPGYRAHQILEPELLKQTQGEIFKTQTTLNLAVNGTGFFVLRRRDHQFYTRDGRFSLHGGRLVGFEGDAVQVYPLDPQGNLVGDQTSVRVTLDPRTKLYDKLFTGLVFLPGGRLCGEFRQTDPVTGDESVQLTQLYQVALAAFEAPERLRETDTRLEANEASGPALLGISGQGSLGDVRAGSLELANVDFMEEGEAIRALQAYSNMLLDGSRKTEVNYAKWGQRWFPGPALP